MPKTTRYLCSARLTFIFQSQVLSRDELKIEMISFSKFEHFSRSPTNDTSRMISGIGALNASADVESSNVGRIDSGTAPPPAPILGRRKRFPPITSNLTGGFLNVTGKPIAPTVLNWNKVLNLECSAGNTPVGSDGSFGVLPHGTLSWSNQGVRISQEAAAHQGFVRGRLDFSPLAVLSPFTASATSSQVMWADVS